MFNELTIGYLFLGGSGAGAVLVLAFLELANLGRYGVRPLSGKFVRVFGRALFFMRRRFAAPHDLLVAGWLVAAGLLLLGAACLFIDLGHPDRIWRLLITTAPTVMTVGGWALIASITCAGIFFVLSVLDHSRFKPTYILVLAIVSMVVAFITMLYTGLLLQSFASVMAYRTWMIPALFTLSSLSCGIALVIGVDSFVDSRMLSVGALSRLLRFDRILIVLELVLLGMYVLWVVNQQSLELTTTALFSGELASWLWGGLVVGGLIVPFIMERFYGLGSSKGMNLIIAGCILGGGLVLRLCIADLSTLDPIWSLPYEDSLGWLSTSDNPPLL